MMHFISLVHFNEVVKSTISGLKGTEK